MINDNRTIRRLILAEISKTIAAPTSVKTLVTGELFYDIFLKRDDLPNDIGVPGTRGFGVGVCPESLPSGMIGLDGYNDSASDNYGNYQYSDGSIMVWIPAFYYKWGTGSNGLTVNAVDIKPFSTYTNVTTANAAGYALHRAFYDGGDVKSGVFVDKYICSNNGGVASSIKNGIVLTSRQRGSLSTAVFSALNGAPANNLGGAVAAAKTRGADFFVNSRFIFATLALLSYAHGQAATSSTYCAWYDSTGVANFPKGCNNDALGDAQDASIRYVSDGYSDRYGYLSCGKTGSANFFSRTTHNGQNCGIADLNGLVWEQTPGLTSDRTNFYILKTSVAMKSVTGGNKLATDLYGATGIAAMYDNLGTTYESLTNSSTNRAYGSANQVFSTATSGNAWNFAGLGGLLTTGTDGQNAFGNDFYFERLINEMSPISGGDWYSSSDVGDPYSSSNAGVWALVLGSYRAESDHSTGFRSALYL